MSNGINSPYGLIAVESVSGSGATRKMKAYKLAVNADGTTTAPAMFFGDPVKIQNTGGVGSFTNGLNIVPALIPAAGAAATAVLGPLLGTFIGCTYTDKATGRTIEKNYWAGGPVLANTDVTVYVNDDPNTIFKVQMSTSANNSALVNVQSQTVFQDWMVGQNANLQVGGVVFTAPVGSIPANNPATGTSSNSRSGVYLDGSTISMTAAALGNPGFDVKIIGLAPSSSKDMVNASGNIATLKQTPGLNLPFCDVLVKINNHVFSAGVAGPFNAA